MRSRHLVDPETLAALDEAPELVFSDETLAAIREVELPQLERSPNVTVSERIVPGVDGNPDIRVLIVTPAGVEAGAPGLFHIHGGGYVAGTPELFLGRLTQIAENCGCVIVSTHTASPPRRAGRARSTISTPPSAGCTTTPQRSASIRHGSRSPARARVAAMRRRSRSGRAIAAARRS
jgi:hypothetical protein